MKMTNVSGAVAWTATYDAFGKATVDGSSTVVNNLRFPGQYYDAETGLHYNFHRYYDPNTGRYVTQDSIGIDGGISLFLYVDNNPINDDDPLGLQRGARPSVRGPLNRTNPFPPRREELLPPDLTDPEKKRAPRVPEPPPVCQWMTINICTKECCDYDNCTGECKDPPLTISSPTSIAFQHNIYIRKHERNQISSIGEQRERN